MKRVLSLGFSALASTLILAFSSGCASHTDLETTAESELALPMVHRFKNPEDIRVCWANGYRSDGTDMFASERQAIQAKVTETFGALEAVWLNFHGFEQCRPHDDADVRLLVKTTDAEHAKEIARVPGVGYSVTVDIDPCRSERSKLACIGFQAVRELANAAGAQTRACANNVLSSVAILRLYSLYVAGRDPLARIYTGTSYRGDLLLLGPGRFPLRKEEFNFAIDSGLPPMQSLRLSPDASAQIATPLRPGAQRYRSVSTVDTNAVSLGPAGFNGDIVVSAQVRAYPSSSFSGPSIALAPGSYFADSPSFPRGLARGIGSLRVPPTVAIKLCATANANECTTFVKSVRALPKSLSAPRYIEVVPTVVAHGAAYFAGNYRVLTPGEYPAADLPLASIQSVRVGSGLVVNLLDKEHQSLAMYTDAFGGTPHVPDAIREKIAFVAVSRAPAMAAIAGEPTTVIDESTPMPEPVCSDTRFTAVLRSGICDVTLAGTAGTWGGHSLFPNAEPLVRNTMCTFTWTSPTGAAADVDALSKSTDAQTVNRECSPPCIRGNCSVPAVDEVLATAVPVVVPPRATAVSVTATVPSLSSDTPLCVNALHRTSPGRDACPACSRGFGQIIRGDAYVLMGKASATSVTLYNQAGARTPVVATTGAQTFVVRNAFPGIERGQVYAVQ